MTEKDQQASEALEEVGSALALALAGLASDMLAGKKRIVVVSDPFWTKHTPPGENHGLLAIGYRHTIEVEDTEIPDCATAGA